MKKQSLKSLFKISGITRRWIINVMSVVVFVVAAAVIEFSILCYTSVTSSVIDNGKSYSHSFGALAFADRDTFSKKAVELAENFENRDKIEVQVFDSSGNLVATTSGFYDNTDSAKLLDYTEAQKSKSGFAYSRSKTEGGEPVLSATEVLPDYGSGSLGSYRWTTSIEKINIYMTAIIAFIILIGLGMIFIAMISGIYFIRSFVGPVHTVTQAAEKIAAGNLTDRLKVDRKDEIGELYEAINNMAEELERTDKIKNDFISSVSHELRTPLTAIKGWGETAKLCIGEDEQTVERGIDVILTEANRLSNMVEDILDFSRMQSGRLSIRLEKIRCTDVLTEAVNMYTELAAKNHIELTYLVLDSPPFVMADRNRLKQVYINIIDNAIKYSHDGGHIIISSVVEDGCLRTEISDTGSGIAPKDLEHVKEKFFRANKTAPGSGIGLAVADEIMRQHNGFLFVESTEGVGTKVTIVLSIVPDEPQEPEDVTAVYFPPIGEDETVDEAKVATSLSEIENDLNEEKGDKENSHENEKPKEEDNG